VNNNLLFFYKSLFIFHVQKRDYLIRKKTEHHTMHYTRHSFLALMVAVCFLYTAGCTNAVEDEDYKTLVIHALDKLDLINEKIINPYQGITVDELSAMKIFAEQAKSSVEQMVLSDNSKKSKEFFVRAMDSTIEAVSTLEAKADVSLQKVESTAPVTNLFIQIKNDLGSAADIIKVPNKKGY